jgi:hypothetical protein
MKRSEALAEIRQAGYHGDLSKAAAIMSKKRIGMADGRRAYITGQKMKERGESCDCPACKEDKGNGK